MNNCVNCKNYFVRDICGFCRANDNIVEIKHPFFMGGSKKCECYEKVTKDKSKFKYPTKKEGVGMDKEELKYWSISNPLFEFGKREQRGGLNESLATSVQITEQEFKELLNDSNNDYKYYCYDNRCKQILFCGKYELKYMWLYIQLKN